MASSTDTARNLSVAIGGPTSLFSTDQKQSSTCRFFADEARTTVAVCEDLDQAGVDLALAWGIAPDAMLVVQGLDYWMWCRANLDHVTRSLSAPPGEPPAASKLPPRGSTYAVAPSSPSGEPVSIYTAAHADISVRDADHVLLEMDHETLVNQHEQVQRVIAQRRSEVEGMLGVLDRLGIPRP